MASPPSRLPTNWARTGGSLAATSASSRNAGPAPPRGNARRLSRTQCAAVFREAMQGWFRSQQPKLTTTEQTNSEDEKVKTTTRRQEGPGDKTFLMAAVAALKAIRQFDADPQAKDRDAGDEVYLAILQLLTPEQVDNLNHVQLQRVRRAVDALERKLKPTEDKRKTAKETLLAFTEHTKRNCRRNWHHKTLAAMLDRVARKECRRLMVFMPPQHGKSELVSRRFPA